MSGRRQVQTMKYFLQYGKFSSNMGGPNFVLARAPYNLGPSWLYVSSNTYPIVLSVKSRAVDFFRKLNDLLAKHSYALADFNNTSDSVKARRRNDHSLNATPQPCNFFALRLLAKQSTGRREMVFLKTTCSSGTCRQGRPGQLCPQGKLQYFTKHSGQPLKIDS